MTIQPIGPAAAALFLTPDDLSPYGSTPEALTQTLALRLVRRALLQAGLHSEGPMEIEAYHDPCGVLVFARLSRRPLFVFERPEDLLAALRVCAPGPGDEAVFHRGRWWLILRTADRRRSCLLSDFASPEEEEGPSGPGTVRISGAVLARMAERRPD